MTISKQPGVEEPSGIKTLSADKSDRYRVEYAKDVVYDIRDGIALHLQILSSIYPAAGPGQSNARQPQSACPLAVTA